MKSRPGETPMPEPLAYFITWTTYGTWLPGDDRCWHDYGQGERSPDSKLKEAATRRMKESAVELDSSQRALVEETIRRHCEIRNWALHAVNCRTQHVHVVVTASQRHPDDVMEQFKSWCTRNLKKQQSEAGVRIREKWWTERGSQRWINDDVSLEAAIRYVQECQ